MIIIIGLGNPGEQYKNTRHNVGFMAVEKFASKNDFPEFKMDKKANALVSKKGKTMLAEPQTFMNESGKSARALKKCADKPVVALAHDDADLPLGKIKIVQERGSAGHKGVESVIKAIGNKGLVRFRIGIGQKKSTDAMKIVLKNFSSDEQKILDKALKEAVLAMETFIEEGPAKTMNQFNQ